MSLLLAPKIPIFITAIGVMIHLLGILGLLPIASFELDIVMFIIDILVVFGLIKRKKWGWYLALALFIQQSIMQPYWAYKSFLLGGFVVHQLEVLIPPFLVMSCLIILIKSRDIYLKY